MAGQPLPPGTYEAADKAWSNWPGASDSERDELEAALLAAAPLIRADERERVAAHLDRLADNLPPDRRTAFRAAAEVVRKGAQMQERSDDKEDR